MYSAATKNNQTSTSSVTNATLKNGTKFVHRKETDSSDQLGLSSLVSGSGKENVLSSMMTSGSENGAPLAKVIRTSSIQPKLTIGKPGDKFEQEADRMADSVATAPSAASQLAPLQRSGDDEEEKVQSKSLMQLQEEEEQPQAKPDLQKQEEDEVQTKHLLQLQDKEEEPQAKFDLQRMEKEEEVQGKFFIQKQTEEEEPVQKRVQLQEEEEKVQGKYLIQQEKSGEQEEEVQSKRSIQLQEDEEEVQQQEDKEEVQQKSLMQLQEEEDQPQAKLDLQKQEEVEEKAQTMPAVQRSTTGETTASESFQSDLKSSKAGGNALSEDTKSQMEPHFNADFSNVKVHTDTNAVQMNKDIGAQAFTHGNHIYFNEGKYNPGTSSGKHLLAHELTHTVQQGASVQKKPQISRVSGKPVQRGLLGAIGGAIVGGVKAVGGAISSVAGAAKDAILGKIAGWANDIPGFHLLTVILGKNPITGKKVPRNATNFVHGFLSLVPGGNKIFENLQKSGALQKAFDWLGKAVAKLNLSWTVIKSLFKKAWDSLSAADVLNPIGAFNKIKAIFGPPLGRIKDFAFSIGKKILEFIFEGVLMLTGPFGAKVLSVFKKAGNAFTAIISDPIGFIGNLISAVVKGFKQFSSNIWTHLKAALVGWLFGAMEGAGITLPPKFDLKGIISLFLQVLGLTYANLRSKLVKDIGEPAVAKLEMAFEFIKILVTEGIAGVWKKLLEFADNLVGTVLDAVKDWVITKIVTAAVTKLISMFNPAGAIIQAIISAYNAIAFFIERFKQILELANAVFDSIINIAAGKIGAAANYVEKTMARTLPVIISFLAGQVGLGGISGHIKKIIDKIRQPVDKALDKIVKWVVEKGSSFIKKGKEKIQDLLFPKKPFTVGKESHTVETKKSGKNYKIIIRSDAQEIDKFIATAREKGKDDPAVLEEAAQLDAMNKEWEAIPDSKANRQKKKSKYEKIVFKAQSIYKKLPEDTAEVEDSKINISPAGGRATKVTANPLTPKSSKYVGSQPQEEVPGWDTSFKKSGKKIAYIRAHLLHHLLHGPGTKENLTPTSSSINQKMYHGVEKHALGWLGVKPFNKARQQKVQLDYKTEIGYDTSAPDARLHNIAKKVHIEATVIKGKELVGANSKSYDGENY